MKPPLNFTAYKVTTTRNEYGDYTAVADVALACHFRAITNIVTSSNNETYQSDAMAWFDADSNVVKGDIIKFNNVFYRVERVTEARRLRSSVVQFLKCDLLMYGQIS